MYMRIHTYNNLVRLHIYLPRGKGRGREACWGGGGGLLILEEFNTEESSK